MTRRLAPVLAVAFMLAGCTAAPEPVPVPVPTATPTPTTNGYPFPTLPLVDTGEREGATGAFRKSDGTYLVAPGDGALTIIQRFDLTLLAQLVMESGEEYRADIDLHAGERLTLLPNPQLIDDFSVVDGGHQLGAMGTATFEEDGTPRTYTVVEGDSADAIRARFNIWWDQLASDDGVRLIKQATVYPGDVLLFTWSRVAIDERP